MNNIFKAVQILVNNNPTLKMGIVQVGASLAAIGGTEKERFKADADYWDRAEAAKTPTEQEALFMEALTKRLAVNGDDAGMGLIEAAAESVPLRRLWVNPDCGLKTRGYAETEESLANLVEATRRVRARRGAQD